MTKRKYHWTRYWNEPHSQMPLDHHGFLTEPNGSPSFGQTFELKTLADLEECKCLILIGEPGLGKTTVLADEAARIRLAFPEAGVFEIKLGEFDNTDLRDFCDTDPDFIGWKTSGKDLYLFMDGLDEGVARSETIQGVIERQLKLIPKEKLKLRITCRSAELPKNFRDKMAHLFENAPVYTIAPLRLSDVEMAVDTAIPGDRDNFLREIVDKDVIPLATRPLTLEFLIDEYIPSRSLIGSRDEIYSKGCLRLCEEQNDIRTESTVVSLSGSLDPSKKRIIAGRIAAVMLLANRVRLNTNLTFTPDQGEVTAAEVADPGEGIDTFLVGEREVAEAGRTSLFTGSGRWAHPAYPEFLAAWYLNQHEVPVAQVKTLFTTESGGERRVVRHLQETLSWFAAMNRNVFDYVIQQEPAILLRNASLLPIDQREALVSSIFDANSESKLNAWTLSQKSDLVKLSHPGLGRQILSAISSTNCGPRQRMLAIDIAIATMVPGLARELSMIALDQSSNPELRIHATRYVMELGDLGDKEKLLPLLVDPTLDDHADDVRGIILLGAWPSIINHEEIFNYIDDVAEDSYSVYVFFINKSLIPQLLDGDVSVELIEKGLNWLENRPIEPKDPLAVSRLLRLEEAVVIAAISRLSEIKSVKSAMHYTLLRLMSDHDFLGEFSDSARKLQTILGSADATRRLILEMVLEQDITTLDHWSLASILRRLGVLSHSDLQILIQKMVDEPSRDKKLAIAQLVESIIDFSQRADWEALYSSIQIDSILKAHFEYLYGAIELTSERADRLRQISGLSQGKTQQPKRLPIDSDPKATISQQLIQIEGGNLDLWPRLLTWLTLTPESTMLGEILKRDVTELPGWLSADDGTRERIVDAALTYIQEKTGTDKSWFGKSQKPINSLSPIKALLLAYRFRRPVVESLDKSQWQEWIPEIIDSIDDYASRVLGAQELARLAYVSGPAQFRARIFEYIQALGPDALYPSLEHLRFALDNELLDRIFIEIAPIIESGVRMPIVALLLEQLHAKTFEWAIEKIRQIREGNEGYDFYVFLAMQLLVTFPAQSWPVIYHSLNAVKEFAFAFFSEAGNKYFAAPPFDGKLNEQILEEMASFLFLHFASTGDQRTNGVSDISKDDYIRFIKGGIIDYLSKLGTRDSIVTLQSLVCKFPEQEGLTHVLLTAQIALANTTWVPPSPREIIEMIRNHRRRLLRSEAELLDVVYEQLVEFGEQLKSEKSLARYLWDEGVDGNYWPKHEEAISNLAAWFLNLHLSPLGLVVSREVQIHLKEETDIHIDVPPKANKSDRTLKVIVEVKKSSNSEVYDALEHQLVGRYLSGPDCKHGIYLVAWDGLPGSPDDGMAEFQRQEQVKAMELSKPPIQVMALVIDMTIPDTLQSRLKKLMEDKKLSEEQIQLVKELMLAKQRIREMKGASEKELEPLVEIMAKKGLELFNNLKSDKRAPRFPKKYIESRKGLTQGQEDFYRDLQAVDRLLNGIAKPRTRVVSDTEGENDENAVD